MSKKISEELTELMVGVVTEGTGTAGAIPQAQVAGKTGTAELGPEPGQENRKPAPDQGRLVLSVRAGRRPKLAIGVLLIDAGAAGGEVAAPIASQILAAGL